MTVPADSAGDVAKVAAGPVAPRTVEMHRQWRYLLLVFLGGCLGTLARWGVGAAIGDAGYWPMGTFTVNLVGCLALGWLLEGLARSGPDEGWRRLVRLCLGTGFCGSFTTYSSLATETVLLGRDRPVLAASYLAVSVVAGVLTAWVGVHMAARTVGTASRHEASARGRHRASTRPDESSSHLPAHSTPSRHSQDESNEGPNGARDQHPLRGGQR